MKWRVYYLGRTDGAIGAPAERRAIVEARDRADALRVFWHQRATVPGFDEVFTVDPNAECIDPDSPHSWQQIAAAW